MTRPDEARPPGMPPRRRSTSRPAPFTAGKKPFGAAAASGPSTLGSALSQLFALKGYAQAKGDAQLAETWKNLVGDRIATRTTVLGVNRGVLQIGVSSAAMLGELASFHRDRLVGELKEKFPALKLRDIKFRLRGDLASGRREPPGPDSQDANAS